MMAILRALEPIKLQPKFMIVEEMDEFTEVLFFLRGVYQIGYSINREYRFPLKFNGCRVIGAYGVSFNERSMFAYKTSEKCHGYFIRKSNWLSIIENSDYTHITDIFKKIVKKEFVANVKKRLLECKEFELRKLSERADIDNVLSLQTLSKKKTKMHERLLTELHKKKILNDSSLVEA